MVQVIRGILLATSDSYCSWTRYQSHLDWHVACIACMYMCGTHFSKLQQIIIINIGLLLIIVSALII